MCQVTGSQRLLQKNQLPAGDPCIGLDRFVTPSLRLTHVIKILRDECVKRHESFRLIEKARKDQRKRFTDVIEEERVLIGLEMGGIWMAERK